MTLDELRIGGSAVIKTVNGEGALRLRLLDMGLIPRTRVSMIKIAPMGDPMEIMVRGYELTLRREDAAKIEVEEVADK
ncbi:MAG: FeoA family protein [Eubacteriales bacterium]|nr:ferrous iron transport protein A [Clostridiales bacterium]MDD7594073.1 FeoA family protein [Clostridiales bacterium]MDY5859429.1 FeoA family protein [Eubacteriales bacterium]HCG67614.1 ferrous iron transport protein A [Clostridiales bacterium]